MEAPSDRLLTAPNAIELLLLNGRINSQHFRELLSRQMLTVVDSGVQTVEAIISRPSSTFKLIIFARIRAKGISSLPLASLSFFLGVRARLNSNKNSTRIRRVPWRTWRPHVMSVRGPNKVGGVVQTDATSLCYASVLKEEKKMLRVTVGSKIWPVSNVAQQLPATHNNMQRFITQKISQSVFKIMYAIKMTCPDLEYLKSVLLGGQN